MNQPNDCCSPCAVVPPVNIPGTQGNPGTPGTNGINAFSTVAANFNVPAVGANVSATFDECAWMVVGQNVFAIGPANFQVVTVVGTTGATLKFLGYTGDVLPGTVIAAGTKVSPAGLQGPAAAGFGIMAVRIFTILSPGIYSPAANVKGLYIECFGAGGGGGGGAGGANASCGSGGGGGGYAALFTTTGITGTNFVVTVGTGGLASGAGNNPGGNGGGTNVTGGGNSCASNGGSGGVGGGAGAATALLTIGGAGATLFATAGDVVFQGDAGGISNRVSGTVGASGKGGNGPFGGGALALVTQGNGNTGGNYGAGGSGGCTLGGGAATSGGAGMDGLVRIWELG